MLIDQVNSKPSPSNFPSQSQQQQVVSDCAKIKSFHTSLMSAFDDTQCTFPSVRANYECTVPAIEVLEKCIHGLKVGKECVMKIYKTLEDKGHKRCFCGGYKKLTMMTSLTEQAFCSENTRQGRGPILLAAMQAALAVIAPTTTSTTTSTTTTTTSSTSSTSTASSTTVSSTTSS